MPIRVLLQSALRCSVVVFVFLAATLTAAQAHGPTRQKVTKKVVIDAPIDKVWAVVGNFQDANWRPDVSKTEGSGGNAVDATRVLTLEGGGTMDQLLTKYKDGQMLFYEITKVDVKVLPVTNYSARFTVTEEGGKTTVTWRAAFYRGYPNNDPPPELNDATAIKAVTAMVMAGLEALKVKIEGSSS